MSPAHSVNSLGDRRMGGVRVLGLDVGTKRIGVAMSDELLITAQAALTIERRTLHQDMEKIKDIIEGNNISEVVVGLPLNMDGTYSAKTKEVIEFMDSLSKAIGVPVKTWDERLTTVQAERVLLEADASRAKRKLLTDKLAAQVILQTYLNSLKRG